MVHWPLKQCDEPEYLETQLCWILNQSEWTFFLPHAKTKQKQTLSYRYIAATGHDKALARWLYSR